MEIAEAFYIHVSIGSVLPTTGIPAPIAERETAPPNNQSRAALRVHIYGTDSEHHPLCLSPTSDVCYSKQVPHTLLHYG